MLTRDARRYYGRVSLIEYVESEPDARRAALVVGKLKPKDGERLVVVVFRRKDESE
jgi:hypothetical protein